MYYSFHIHTLYLLTLALRTAYCYLEVVNNNNTVIQSFKHHEADFGGIVPYSGIKGRLIYLKSTTNGSCDDYEPAAPVLNGNDDKSIALMERMGCKFVAMVYAAQNLNYSAVIVHNNIANGNKLVRMIGSSVTQHYEHKVMIPAVFVGYDTGVTLSQYIYDAKNNSAYFVRITTKENRSSNKPSFPTYAVVGIGFFFLSSMLCIACVSCCKKNGGVVDRYRRAHRTRSSSVQTDIHLPVLTPTPMRSSMEYLRHIRPATFSKDDTYDVCPICLENFVTEEKLWKLPCDHQFHINCIKPCIEQIDASCPVCRRMFVNSRH